MVDVIEEKSTYMLTDLRLSKYKFTKLLNTTKSAKITPAGDELSLDGENFKDSNHEIIKGTINSIELHSLVEKYLCQKYKAKVDVDDEIVICSYCNTMTTIDGTIKSGNISFTVTGICCKVHLHVTPEILLEQFNRKVQVGKKYVKVKYISSILCNTQSSHKIRKDRLSIYYYQCCYYVEPNPFICTLIWCANQWTSFHIIATLG